MPAGCITAGPKSVSAGNGQPLACATVLQPVPISCHFRGCKSPAVQYCKWRYNRWATFYLLTRYSNISTAEFFMIERSGWILAQDADYGFTERVWLWKTNTWNLIFLSINAQNHMVKNTQLICLYQVLKVATTASITVKDTIVSLSWLLIQLLQTS